MSVLIRNLGEAADSFTDPVPLLFGVRFITEDVGSPVPEGTEVSISATGMFSLGEGSASFRARFAVEVQFFRELWADVALTFTAPESYSIEKSVFLEFANRIVTPQLRNHVQGLWDPLLVEAGYPTRILPPASSLEGTVFMGEHLPETFGPAEMLALRDDAELALPDVKHIELG